MSFKIEFSEETGTPNQSMTTINTKLRRVAHYFQCSAIVFCLLSFYPSLAMAQGEHSHAATQQSKTALDQQNALVKIVRDSTERFKDVKVAEAEGYALLFGCVSGDDFGAMGLHYVNLNLLNSGVLDATRPQIVIYEPKPDGSLRLIGADYLLLSDAWNVNHSGPPELMGQFFHLFTSPNRFGLPTFYTLHVWAWKENPKGAFVNWHPNVSCAAFDGKKP
jgi:hypothetical protein